MQSMTKHLVKFI